MKIILLLIVILISGGMLYIRLAASDPGKWHVSPPPQDQAERQSTGGYSRQFLLKARPKSALEEMDRIIMATPRTTRLAGSVDDGMITYVTRSLIMGFPDYTTVEAKTAEDGRTSLTIYGRLRFGRSDLGVNEKRIKGWVSQFNLV